MNHNIRRGSVGDVSIRIQDSKKNDKQVHPIIENNPIFEIEIWSINKIINKF